MLLAQLSHSLILIEPLAMLKWIEVTDRTFGWESSEHDVKTQIK